MKNKNISMTRIILITGGQRSGKSSEAERMALSLSPRPVYMATAHAWDDEFRERIRRHQERRGPQWTNIEEERHLSRHDLSGRVVVVDCVTLWLTNLLYDSCQAATGPDTAANAPDSAASGINIDHTLKTAQEEFDRLTEQDATFIFVTNEIGSGGVSDNALQRQFTDLEGWMNQYIARRADEVILMVSGIAVKIK